MRLHNFSKQSILAPTGQNTALVTLSPRLIALKAIELAYPDDPPEAQYPGGKPTAEYKAA